MVKKETLQEWNIPGLDINGDLSTNSRELISRHLSSPLDDIFERHNGRDFGARERHKPTGNLSSPSPETTIDDIDWIQKLDSRMISSLPWLRVSLNSSPNSASSEATWNYILQSGQWLYLIHVILSTMKRSIDLGCSGHEFYRCLISCGYLEVHELRKGLKVTISFSIDLNDNVRSWNAKFVVTSTHEKPTKEGIAGKIGYKDRFEANDLDIMDLCVFAVTQTEFLKAFIQCCSETEGYIGRSTICEAPCHAASLDNDGHAASLDIDGHAAVTLVRLVLADVLGYL